MKLDRGMGRGLRWDAAGGNVAGAAAPAWLVGTPVWMTRTTVSRDVVGGIRLTGWTGARSGATLPSFLTDIVGTGRTVAVPATTVDPAAYRTLWDVGLRVERAYHAGHVEFRLFGEGLAAMGPNPDAPGAVQAAVPQRGIPLRLTGRSLRMGLGVGF